MLSIEEIKRFIDEDKTSKKKQQAKVGLRYYEGDNDIKQYRVFYYNKDGKLVEDANALTIRPASSFFKEQIEQKTQFTLSVEDDWIKTDIPQLQEFMKPYFDDEFKSEIASVIDYGSIEGFSYVYVYQNEDDRRAFKFAEGLGIVEVEAKYASDRKDHVIYWYEDIIKSVGEDKDKLVTKIQVWDDKFCYYYIKINEQIKPDKTYAINPKPHITYFDKKEKVTYDTFGFVPFLRYDNNRKQFSDLKPIKEYIDDYDLINYGLSDNILSMSEGYVCVKGFDGDNLDELMQNVRAKKFVGVGADGDLDIKTVNIPTEARKAKMEQDEKDIYRFGMAISTTQMAEGNYTNGVNIKSRYALLDMKCSNAAKNLKVLLKKIVKIVLEEINEVNGTEFTLKDIYFNLDERKTIANELDNENIKLIEAQRKQVEITSLLNIQTLIDNQTLMEQIFNILDLDYEEYKDRLPNPEEETDLNKESEQILNNIIQTPENKEETIVE